MMKCFTQPIAEQFAKERGQRYGMSCIDGHWYVGTFEQLARIGCTYSNETLIQERKDEMEQQKAKPPKKVEYQPKTGAKCSCKRGVQRDNCPACEGTGWCIDFAAIRNRS